MANNSQQKFDNCEPRHLVAWRERLPKCYMISQDPHGFTSGGKDSGHISTLVAGHGDFYSSIDEAADALLEAGATSLHLDGKPLEWSGGLRYAITVDEKGKGVVVCGVLKQYKTLKKAMDVALEKGATSIVFRDIPLQWNEETRYDVVVDEDGRGTITESPAAQYSNIQEALEALIELDNQDS